MLLANETDADLGTDVKGGADDLPGSVTTKHFGGPNPTGKKNTAAAAKRVQGSLNALSGSVLLYSSRCLAEISRRATSMSYVETVIALPFYLDPKLIVLFAESVGKQTTCKRHFEETSWHLQEARSGKEGCSVICAVCVYICNTIACCISSSSTIAGQLLLPTT